jgi:hypothetical protein
MPDANDAAQADPVDKPDSEAPKPAPEAETGSSEPKSRGQELLDRFLTVAKRIDGGARELEGLRSWIDGPKPGSNQPADETASAKPKPTSFFEGMERIAKFLEDVAVRQDKAVNGIKGLF